MQSMPQGDAIVLAQLNPGESERVMTILDGILSTGAGGCSCSEIGIITPYAGQVHPRTNTAESRPAA